MGASCPTTISRLDLRMKRYEKLREAGDHSGKPYLLRLLANHVGWTLQTELLSEAKAGRRHYRFESNLKELEASGVVVRRAGQVRFFDPILRAIVKAVPESIGA